MWSTMTMDADAVGDGDDGVDDAAMVVVVVGAEVAVEARVVEVA